MGGCLPCRRHLRTFPLARSFGTGLMTQVLRSWLALDKPNLRMPPVVSFTESRMREICTPVRRGESGSPHSQGRSLSYSTGFHLFTISSMLLPIYEPQSRANCAQLCYPQWRIC